jgi:hypothetical protein
MTPTTEAGKRLMSVTSSVPPDGQKGLLNFVVHIEQEARTAALTDLRERVILTQLDPCFCDDVGQLPECEACLRVRAVLAEIDRALEP